MEARPGELLSPVNCSPSLGPGVVLFSEFAHVNQHWQCALPRVSHHANQNAVVHAEIASALYKHKQAEIISTYE